MIFGSWSLVARFRKMESGCSWRKNRRAAAMAAIHDGHALGIIVNQHVAIMVEEMLLNGCNAVKDCE